MSNKSTNEIAAALLNWWQSPDSTDEDTAPVVDAIERLQELAKLESYLISN